jgi:hypothetical protein
VTRAALVLALVVAGGCYSDDYTCHSDADCDVEGGRCERDGRCTGFDLACASHQRYTEHSGDLTGTCFDDSVVPANACAAGQAPARREGCFADVCLALPACCDTGWSEACVLDAQLRCGIRCDTSIALTAASNSARETWNLHWEGTKWTATRLPYTALAVYVPPAPGATEPRLAGLGTGNALTIGELPYQLATDHDYQAVTGIDFDRAGRDTLAMTYQQGTPVSHYVELLDLETGTIRAIETGVSLRLVWGDDDHDGFPDGVAGAGNGFRFLDNVDTVDGLAHARTMTNFKSSGVGADPTNGSPALRNFDWIDLDGDGLLDFVAFGNSVRIHLGNDAELSNGPSVNLDCEPVGPAGQCAMPQTASFSGTGAPSVTAKSAVAVATFEAPAGGRNVYLVAIRQRDPIALDITRLDTCPTCQPFLAMAARALDDDQLIDLIGVDDKLHVWTALSTRGMTFVESAPIQTVMRVTQVNLSVTGISP